MVFYADVLVKHLQSDLSDQFTKFVSEVFSMKNLKPLTAGQSMILKKIIAVWNQLYFYVTLW